MVTTKQYDFITRLSGTAHRAGDGTAGLRQASSARTVVNSQN
jgi:hypothetical protein